MTGSASRDFMAAVVQFFLSPLGLMTLAALLLWRRAGRRTAALWLLGLLALCTPLTGKLTLRTVESLCPPSTGERPAAILVLAGGAVYNGRRFVVSPASERRLQTAVEQTGDMPLILLGIESPLMARWLDEHHDARLHLTERTSRTTEENLRRAGPLLVLWPTNAPIGLVTDRFHMTRALLWAHFFMPRRHFVPIPVPGYAPPIRVPFDLLPSSRGLEYTTLALRESIALARDWLLIKWREWNVLDSPEQSIASGHHTEI